MAKYTSVSISGYNATPPSDDGTVSEANKVKWSTEKTKLTDPLKTAIESINTNIVSALDVGPTALVTNTTLGTSHYGDFIQVSGSGVTLTLTDAATLGAGWYCEIVNTDSTNTVTIGRATGTDTINGTAANISLLPYQAISVFVNAAANGFIATAKRTHSKTNNIAENTVFTGDVSITGDTSLSGDVSLATDVTGNVWSTGDVKITFKTTADTGWVMMNDGSIGSATSGATTRANADTETLYTLLWTNISNTWAPVSTGRGASAAADFAANKTLTLPRTLGRALAVSGAGASLTSRALGEYLGAETHSLSEAELAVHAHTERVYDRATSSVVNFGTGPSAGTAVTVSTAVNSAVDDAGGAGLTTDNAGSGSAHNNMPPESFMNVMVKL